MRLNEKIELSLKGRPSKHQKLIEPFSVAGLCKHMEVRTMKKKINKLILFTLALTAVFLGNNVSAQTILLDNFEADSIRVVNPSETEPTYRFLWNQYTGDFYAGPDPGTAGISTAQAHDGSRSLKVDVTGGSIYLQFYPNNGTWRFMHEYVQPPSAWTQNKYNAMRFWVKVPKQMVAASGGHENVQIGTYVRAQNGDAYSQGTHYYHFYNLKYTGEWEQIIFDSHPTYLIGAGGNTEVGNVAYPSGGSTWNYMDGLTRFYIDGQGGLSGYPATFYFDGFELFTRPVNENIDQVYSLHGVYVPSTNEISVGWARRKDQDTLVYEVRTAFQDINSIGWNAATPAPNGTINSNGALAYNLMEYSTRNISMGSNSTIYVAIKPQSASLFRQIAIPLSNSNPPAGSAPTPPANLRVP